MAFLLKDESPPHLRFTCRASGESVTRRAARMRTAVTAGARVRPDLWTRFPAGKTVV